MSGLVDTAQSDGNVYYTLAQPRLRELLACLDRCRAA